MVTSQECDFLGVLPNFHAFGVTVLTLCPLILGCKGIYTARFVPRRLVELMKTHRPAAFVAVPSMYAALANVKKASPEDASSLKIVISGAEPLPEAVSSAFKERFGVDILEGYGLTEMSPATHWSLPPDATPGTVGRALPGVDTFIVDEDGKTLLSTGESGEIFLAGPNLMKGYLNLPEQTSEAVVQLEVEGRGSVRCLRTGDIGCVNTKGELAITGRKKEMLIVAGENVFPREIEEVLDQHDAVLATGVVGRQDDLRGEVPIAFVELQPDASVSESDLRTHAQQTLPTHKVPKEVRILEKLPRNPTGKILRKDLKTLV